MADITTGPWVPRTPKAQIVEDPGGTPVISDISCAVQYFDASADVEELDASTYCKPGATETGKVTNSLVIGLRWSEELYNLLEPLVGTAVNFEVLANEGDTNGAIFNIRFGAVPFGRWEVGQLIDVELACAVLTEPTMGPLTV